MKHKGLLHVVTQSFDASTQEEEQADFYQSKSSLTTEQVLVKTRKRKGKGKTAENSRWDSQKQPEKEMEEEERDKDTVRHGGQPAAKGQTAGLIRNEVKELPGKAESPPSWSLASERREKS